MLKDAEKAAQLRKNGKLAHIPANYKLVRTCTGRFDSDSPYFYASYDETNEAEDYLKNLKNRSSKGTIVVLGDKYSDRHTIRIHGQMYLGVEPPFVRAIS